MHSQTVRGRRPATPGEIERARDLHAAGHSLAQIGAELGRARETVRIWVNPTAAQRNGERAKAYSKQVKPPVKGRSCQQCAGPVRSAKARICGKCRARNGQSVNTQVANLYRTGKALPEIAERVGLTEAAVLQRAHRLRSKGVDVPRAAYMPRGVHPDRHRFGFIRKADWKPPPLPAPRPVRRNPQELAALIEEQARQDNLYSWGEGGKYTVSLEAPLFRDGTKTLLDMLDIVQAPSYNEIAALMESNRGLV